MSVASIIVFIVLACFTLWLVIDTTIWAIKKHKNKRVKKAQEDNKEVQVIENTDNQN